MIADYAYPQSAKGLFDRKNTGWMAVFILAAAVYFFGLGGQYIPTNGDELVYAHITRLTAASQHWLPLASELDHMRNTKPPLLFWQGMVASGWGQHWTLFALRLPSVIYTLLIAALVAGLVRRISGNTGTALAAACVYLAFFCTFRYGRPFLTSAAETFWLDLPLFALLWACTRGPGKTAQKPPFLEQIIATIRIQQAQTATFYIAFIFFAGLCWGLGSAYKSFALIAPAAAALWCALLLCGPRLNWRILLHTSVQCGVAMLLALAIFGLWFVLDPDPAAVWQEFVIGENAAKMNDKHGYWHIALYGGDYSLWAQALAYVQNTGLLAFVVLGLGWRGVSAFFYRYKNRSNSVNPVLPLWLLVLLTWLAIWLIVFCIPSQRSARYVIPAMPGLAMLIALYWQQIGRGWFVLSLVLTTVTLTALARIGWVMHDLGIASLPDLTGLGVAVALGLAATLAALLKSAWTRACTVAACLAVYASFNLLVQPLDGLPGRYSSEVSAQFSNTRIAVPSNFNAQYERFQFLLPGQGNNNRFVPFDMGLLTDGKTSEETLSQLLNQLLMEHDAVVWLASNPSQTVPPCLPACTLMASRWVVKERHKSGDITLQNLWHPHTWLFNREWLVKRPLY
jgi:4-amino-4-deoxy-L-arabinose transferase-like glycosyltransferase